MSLNVGQSPRAPLLAYASQTLPKGDARRTFILLHAINQLGSPSAGQLESATGQKRINISRLLTTVTEQYGVVVAFCSGGTRREYQIVEWGPLLSPEKLDRFLVANNLIKDVEGSHQ